MAKPKKRDNSYWRGRLKRGYADIYEELRDGKIRSVRAARMKAGLIRQPTRLDDLKRSWERSTPAQREAFVDFITPRPKIVLPKPKIVLPKPKVVTSHTDLADAAGYFKPDVKKLIRERMSADHLRSADLMKRMGFSRFDTSLMSALSSKRPQKPSPALQSKVLLWLQSAPGTFPSGSKGRPHGKAKK